jgi:hypothetical protein
MNIEEKIWKRKPYFRNMEGGIKKEKRREKGRERTEQEISKGSHKLWRSTGIGIMTTSSQLLDL